jgi:esterase/lipase superfamily enzyme
MSRYWMITNRTVEPDDVFLGNGRSNDLSFWTADQGPLKDRRNWTRVADAAAFEARLAAAAQQFPPLLSDEDHAAQKHVTLFVHGYNNNWSDAAGRYEKLCQSMFTGDRGLGECVLFTWPSNGRVADYLADRSDAAASGAALADVLSQLYDWMIRKQADAAIDPARACRAKISVIAHSMGNFVLQKAAQVAWTRKNQPLLVSLINQCLMLAADVDNDLFEAGEAQDKSDGNALANLCYRITALYTGLDEVLGVSAGLKHFGKRRLGRSGLDRSVPVPDNVWDVDCTDFFEPPEPRPPSIHSAYFDEAKTQALMTQLLRGVDRRVLLSRGALSP